MSEDLDRERVLLGIDIGGTKTVVVLARANGEILAESRLEDWTSGSWEADVRKLEQHAKVLMRGAGVAEEALHAIGLSAPGPLNPVTGVVIDCPNVPGWKGVPLVESLFNAFGVQVLLENDANAAALAEWRFGAGQGARSLIYLTMSTGCGAGLILEGRLYRGSTFQAGEVGHIPVAPEGRLCHCGLRGCLEAYVGGAAIGDQMREAVQAGKADMILELADGDPERISARLWIEALRAGDDYALALREDFLNHLAQGLATLIASFDPDTIVLGTIVRENKDLFMEDLRERVYARVWPSLRHVKIEAGLLGERLPAYAALCVAALEPLDLAPPDSSRP
jgi:glucokinase